MMSLHGISHDAWKRYTKEGAWYYEVLYPGFKYNLTDIAAAIGIEQLRKSDSFFAARQRIASAYDHGFSDLEEVELPVQLDDRQQSCHLYIIKINSDRLRIDRNRFIESLREKGIGTSVHFIPLHLHPYYKQTLGYSRQDFPNATGAFERIISLPIYPKMTDANVGCVIDAVRKIATEHRR
jgi:perosamine synthetase